MIWAAKVFKEYVFIIKDRIVEMLIIAFIQTLKQGNEKCGKDDVFELVKDSLDEKIARETFEELLESLIQSQSIKPNAFGDGECLS